MLGIKVPVQGYGDGLAPKVLRLCPWFRDDPDGMGETKWCANSDETCPFLVTVDNTDNCAICSYGLSTEEADELYANVGCIPTVMPINIQVQGTVHDRFCKCGCNRFFHMESGPHLGLYCGKCGQWQEWVGRPVTNDPDFIISFGKHAGTKISRLPTDYLEWGVKGLKGHMRERFRLALHHRAQLFLMDLFACYDEVRRHDKTAPFDGEPGFDEERLNAMPEFQSIYNVRDRFIGRHPKTTKQTFMRWLYNVSTPQARQEHPAYTVVLLANSMTMRVIYKPSRTDVVEARMLD